MTWLRNEVLSWTSNVLTIFAFTLILAFTLVWCFKRQRKVWLIDQLPGPKGVPILGNALHFNVEAREQFKRFIKFCKYGKVMRMWLANVPYVVISGPRETEILLSSQKHLDKSRDYMFLHPWLGTGLLTATGEKWHSRRKLLTPAFHFKILEDFIDVFNVQSQKMVDNLLKKADGTPFNIFPFVTLCTLDIICETAMGHSANAQDNRDSDYVKAVYKIGYIINKRIARPWLQPEPLFRLFGYAKDHDECLKVLHRFTTDTIKKRRLIPQDIKKEVTTEEDQFLGKKKRLAFLDLLLECSENGKSLTDEDIREEVDTFMFEGHDTTTAAINWALYLLGAHPDVQAKVHEELDSIFGDSNRLVTMDDLREMKLTENCIKEALRLFPSVPYIGRELKEDIVIGNQRIPAGVTAIVVTYALHRDPEQFPDPEVFDPDRFLPENCKNRHPYAYVPFSAGPRNCIGQKFAMMEEKIVLSSVLRKYRIESVDKREDLKILGEIILRPEDGNMIKLFTRKL